MPETPDQLETVPARKIEPAQYDAIHRALLTGLLGNVGHKQDVHEYTGARGRKFHIFPGSGLFSRKPPWVMAAEVVETTRLYARTAARIDPQWVERVAQHLVVRSYSEPQWNRESGHVVALEKVMLWGLVLVPRRRVHYGPIDPKTSREIFIRRAMVEGEYNSDAPYFRNNRDLLRDVELMEAKLRRRDVLVDAATRFAFYDARIPAGIFNAALFEKWRREAESRDKRTLFMQREDLVVAGASAPPAAFPDAMRVGNLHIPLTYHFGPGDPADGVTATIPLASLNQLEAAPFEWLAPGWLEEKVAALIKGLPKELRVRLVPVPDTARAVTPAIKFGEGNFLSALSWHLGRATGMNIPRSQWQPESAPDWLRMNFAVIDESGRSVAAGRDLDELRRKLRVELRQTLAEMSAGPWHRDGLTRWDFPDLPEQVEVRRPGLTVKGFPALIDKGETVSLRLLDTLESARDATRAGVRRLFMLQLAQEIKYLGRHLPGIDAMCLHYATLGPCDELRRDLLSVATDRALHGEEDPRTTPTIRTRDAFTARAEVGWRRLSPAAQEVCALVSQILSAYHGLARQLTATFTPLLEPSIRDMREQLANLAPRGFVTQTSPFWLTQMPRLLKGIELRLRKLLNAGALRDQQAMDEIRPLWEQYLRRVELHRHLAIVDPALTQFRWLLEELRVSLFAQELKTSAPVSVKRLQGLWAEIKA